MNTTINNEIDGYDWIQQFENIAEKIKDGKNTTNVKKIIVNNITLYLFIESL